LCEAQLKVAIFEMEKGFREKRQVALLLFGVATLLALVFAGAAGMFEGEELSVGKRAGTWAAIIAAYGWASYSTLTVTWGADSSRPGDRGYVSKDGFAYGLVVAAMSGASQEELSIYRELATEWISSPFKNEGLFGRFARLAICRNVISRVDTEEQKMLEFQHETCD
jgi:hypothetical protein